MHRVRCGPVPRNPPKRQKMHRRRGEPINLSITSFASAPTIRSQLGFDTPDVSDVSQRDATCAWNYLWDQTTRGQPNLAHCPSGTLPRAARASGDAASLRREGHVHFHTELSSIPTFGY